MIKWALKRTSFFQKFTLSEICKIIEVGEIKYFQTKEIISKKKEYEKNIYICLEGHIN